MPSVLEFLIIALADSFSLNSEGLFQSTQEEDNRIIQEAYDSFQDQLLSDPSLRLLILRDVIYNRIYQAPYEQEAELSSSLRNEISEGTHSPLFAEIDRANVGSGYAEEGWMVQGEMKGELLPVQKEGLTLWVKPETDVISHDFERDWVSIRLPKNLLDPGLYIAVGNAGPVTPQNTRDDIVRFHFNFPKPVSSAVMKFWTLSLNAQSLPFCLAMGYDYYSFERSDPAILSVKKEHRSVVLGLLKSFIEEYGGLMNPEIPVLTKFLALGIAYSEVPNPELFQESNFHLNHAQIIAAGFLEAWERRLELVPTVLAKFQELDIDLNHPYLNPQSEDFNFY